MKTLAIVILNLLLVGSAVPRQQQNPSTVFCDYHNANFYKSGTEYPNGKCYDVYTHPVWSNGQRSIHRMSMRCAQ